MQNLSQEAARQCGGVGAPARQPAGTHSTVAAPCAGSGRHCDGRYVVKNAIDMLSVVGSRAKVVPTATGARRVRGNSELLEQEALIQWADLTVINGHRVGDYLVHVPNEGKRGPKAAREFKRAGGRAGVPRPDTGSAVGAVARPAY